MITQSNASLDFCLGVVRASARLGRLFDRRLGAVHGLGLSDLAILLELDRSPEGRLRRVDLAERLGLTASAVTRALIPLEKIGIVTREPDPTDARVGYATLTATGRRILEEAVATAGETAVDVVSETAAAKCARLIDGIG